MFAGIAGFLILVVGALVVVAFAGTAADHNSNTQASDHRAACASWGAAVQQLTLWHEVNLPPPSGDYVDYPGYAARAAPEEQQVAADEMQAESQTGDQTLRAELQGESLDHQSLAGVFRTYAAGGNDLADYNRFLQAILSDEAQIRARCSSG